VNMSAASPSATLFSLNYDFHYGNGNVWGIINNKDTSRNQTFTYDPLNRLISAQNAGTDCTKTTLNGKTEYWGNSYTYDAWGNLLSKTPTKCSAENITLTAAASNQLQGYGYDAAGNMTHDLTSGKDYTYDQENRITAAAGFTYTYDADGNRVEKSNGTTGTLYWYMTPGIVAESDIAGNLQSEYVFFDGERVARKDLPSNNISYYFSDQLKTASVSTDSVGTIKSESDYYPWGGELQFANGDSNHYKFTGKERDSESGLDYFGARYYSNGVGRFITPDPMGSLQPNKNPQTLNLYMYSLNSPVRFADDEGFSATDRVNRAAQQIGRDYLVIYPDHTTNGGIDCSGLCLKAVGDDLQNFPRTAAAQYQFAQSDGAFSTDSSAVQPGDEIFFADNNGKIDHVAIVSAVNPDGTVEMIEAPHKGAVVSRRKLYAKNFKPGGSWGSAHVAGYGLWHNFDKQNTATKKGVWSTFASWVQSFFTPSSPPKSDSEGTPKRQKTRSCLKHRDGTCA